MNSFYQKYHHSLQKYISTKISDSDVVADIVHDSLLAAHNSLHLFQGKSSEFTWIVSIANHKIIDYYRKKKLKTILFSAAPVLEDIAVSALNPERDVLKNELKQEIKKTFHSLSVGYRNILRLKYIDGLKISDISVKFKLNLKATESLLIRARRQFQKKWNYDFKTTRPHRR